MKRGIIVATLLLYSVFCFGQKEQIIGKYMSKELDGCEMTFYQRGEKIYLKTVYIKRAGKPVEQQVKRRKVNGKMRFDYLNGEMRGEYFIIENDGNLGEYNKEGKRFDIATKM